MDDLFTYQPTARELADEGMNRAVEHADAELPDWSSRAYALLERYARTNREFMAEEIRTWAHKEQGLDLPPSPKAWGAIMVRGRKQKIIRSGGAKLTSIPPAHATYATNWLSCLVA